MAQLDFQINVSGNAGETIGSIKKQLKEANQELIQAQKNFGDYSAEALASAKKVAQLKDSIQEARETADLFDPGKKFQVFSNSINAIAGGFTAAQGAIGLFGGETKELEKQLLKVQSALALSQGLSTITDSAKDFQRLSAVVKDSVVKAFGSLKSAIISTGIGALVVALGLLIANFDAVKKYVLNLIPGLGKVADFIGNLVNKVTDFVGITSEAGRATAKLIKDNEKAIKESERFLDLNADKYDEYTQRKIKANLEFKKKQNEFLNDETLSEAEKIKFVQQARDKANREIASSDQDRVNKQKEIQNKQREEQQKAYEEQQRILQQRREAELKAEEDYQKQNQANAERRKADLKKGQEAIDEENAAKKEQQQKDDEEALERIKDNAFKQFELIKNSQDQQIELQKQFNIDLINAEVQLQDAKFAAASAGLNALSSLVGQNEKLANALFVLDKALAIGKIVVDTQREIAGYAASNSVFGPAGIVLTAKMALAAKIRAAAGIATIAATSIAKFKNGGSSNVGDGTTAPSISASAPVQPQIPQAATTNLSSSTINALGNQAIKAYVVETDVTTNQQRIKAIQQRARFD